MPLFMYTKVILRWLTAGRGRGGTSCKIKKDHSWCENGRLFAVRPSLSQHVLHDPTTTLLSHHSSKHGAFLHHGYGGSQAIYCRHDTTIIPTEPAARCRNTHGETLWNITTALVTLLVQTQWGQKTPNQGTVPPRPPFTIVSNMLVMCLIEWTWWSVWSNRDKIAMLYTAFWCTHTPHTTHTSHINTVQCLRSLEACNVKTTMLGNQLYSPHGWRSATFLSVSLSLPPSLPLSLSLSFSVSLSLCLCRWYFERSLFSCFLLRYSLWVRLRIEATWCMCVCVCVCVLVLLIPTEQRGC